MADENRLSLKVWVDNEKKHVVFAEADCDFVDVLCSFLTLPLGAIIKLLSKKSDLGSIDNLYESIEQLGDQYFPTKACKNMLLSPRSEAVEHCEDLKLNLVDGPKREFYFCEMDDCISRPTAYFSSVRDTRCNYCDRFMNKVQQSEKGEKTKNDGVFVKRNNAKFIITNDFHVTTCSLFHCYDLLKSLGVKDIDLLEVKTVQFGKKELFCLFKNFLIGKDALTSICFPNLYVRCTTPITNTGMKMKRFKSEDHAELGLRYMKIKLIMNKTNNNVVYAEINDKFTEQLFSFLTFPLGSILNLVGCYNSLGHMTNLYRSIQEMKINSFKSEERRRMLLSPQLAPFFGSREQMLSVRESPLYQCSNYYEDLKNEFKSTIKCKYKVNTSCLIGLDPKIGKTREYGDRGFVRKDRSFLVTDDLHVVPISIRSVTQFLKKQGLQIDHLEKKVINVTRVQVCALLRAMLISKTVLSDVFFPYGK